ncbi:MAG TPA: hypothetical protein PK177_10280 [Burkholderiaceae bacterium]|nr:hypothetical protein [Burkholderiaceae bacterium]
MADTSQSSEDAVLRSFAVYQDALVRIADVAKQAGAEMLAEPVKEICYQAHREVAAILSSDHAQPKPDVQSSAGDTAPTRLPHIRADLAA